MNFKISEWSLIELYNNRDRIDIPIFQREEIWSERKDLDLIDSIFRGFDIPKLYFHRVKDKKADGWECIDGRQRIRAIIRFFNNEFEYEKKKFDELDLEKKKKFENYKLTIATVDKIDDYEIRLLFIRLQLGIPTNCGEKLNAIRSNLREFVEEIKDLEFIKFLSIPSRRFSKQQVCAQILNNSKFLNKTGEFRSSKYEDLRDLYQDYNNLSLKSNDLAEIKKIIVHLSKIFGINSKQIKSRASAVSLYLLFEELENEISKKENDFKNFYLLFLKRLYEESKKGINAKNKFLVNYQNKIIQGADSKGAIQFRHDNLKKAFEYYLTKNKIIEDY
jgi:hypothetical protein